MLEPKETILSILEEYWDRMGLSEDQRSVEAFRCGLTLNEHGEEFARDLAGEHALNHGALCPCGCSWGGSGEEDADEWPERSGWQN